MVRDDPGAPPFDTQSTRAAPKTPTRRIVVECIFVGLGIALLLWAWRADRRWFEVHTMHNRCAENSYELTRYAIERGILALCGLVVALGLRPAAGRWAARHSPGELLGSVARIGVAIVLAIGVSELVLRWKMNVGLTSVLCEVPATHVDPRYGWRYDAPHTNDNIVMDGRVVPLAINARGERARTESDLPDLSRPTIVFAGESVVLGLGITYEESFPALVGEAMGVQTANLAVHGYGDDQSYVVLRDRLPEFEHPIAVVQLVFEGLLERDVERERSHLRLREDGTFVSIPRTPREDRWRLLLLAERLARYQSDEAIDIARTTYRAMVAMAKARGAVPLIVLTNYQGGCLPDETGAPSIERILFGEQDLPYIRVDLDPTWILPNGHPDARASRKLAEAVQAALAPQLLARGRL